MCVVNLTHQCNMISCYMNSELPSINFLTITKVEFDGNKGLAWIILLDLIISLISKSLLTYRKCLAF